MMHEFLFNNRDDLIARCKAKVALRPQRDATDEQLKNGVPLLFDQLRRTLEAEQRSDDKSSLEISGSSGVKKLPPIRTKGWVSWCMNFEIA